MRTRRGGGRGKENEQHKPFLTAAAGPTGPGLGPDGPTGPTGPTSRSRLAIVWDCNFSHFDFRIESMRAQGVVTTSLEGVIAEVCSAKVQFGYWTLPMSRPGDSIR